MHCLGSDALLWMVRKGDEWQDRVSYAEMKDAMRVEFGSDLTRGGILHRRGAMP